jgi:hypothetical protein
MAPTSEPPSDEVDLLQQRLGRLHALQRLGVEKDHEAQVFGQGLNFFRIENSAISALAIELTLKVTGLFWRGRRNAARIDVRQNHVAAPALPTTFEGFSILQLSDLHCDMSVTAIQRVAEHLETLRYDVCVLTGDYRAETFGPSEAALDILGELRPCIRGPVFGVLGNHDSIRMLPALEQMGVRMLMNEVDIIERDGDRIHIAGIDDAHFYRAHNIEKAAAPIPHEEFSICFPAPLKSTARRRMQASTFY